MAKKDKAQPYQVGNKCPPKEHQFKPGQSGCPTGRPKGSLGLKTKLAQEMAKTIAVKKNGKLVKMKKEDVIVERIVENSMRGDLRSTSLLIAMTQDEGGQAGATGPSVEPIKLDTAALQRIASRLARKIEENS